ncbi:MAG: histidine kinase, partial [Clostridia bacterium]|nr:histidine kinase [Clostridia bacterium]
HFLYNTLNLIRSFAQCNYVEAVDQTIVSLGEILRYSLKPARYTSLEEELKHVYDYIVIQQLRFKDSIFVTKIIDDSLLDCRVIKFILQPIVENAFHHALEVKKQNRCLTLSVAKQDGALVISIGDNGEGMSPDVLDNLKRQLTTMTENLQHNQSDLDAINSVAGIGLINAHKRLLYAYGLGYGVRIDSRVGQGTIVTLTLPIRSFDDTPDTDVRRI